MLKSTKSFGLAAVAIVLLALPTAARAAFIIVNDSDPNTITLTAGDFEGGFSVNGNLLTSGLGNVGGVTLPDAGYTFEGSWIDLGATTGGTFVHFALPANPTGVTSGIDLRASTDGTNGSLLGSSYGGFDGATYFIGSLTYDQNGQTVLFSLPFLSGSFTSEAAVSQPAVPEPSTLVLLASVLPVAFVTWRRRRAS